MILRFTRVLMLIACASCGVQNIAEVESKQVYAVLLQHYNDSCGTLCKRLVFTNTPCGKRQYFNRQGKALKPMMSEADKDSLCFSCSEMNNPRAAMIEPVGYGKDYAYSIMTHYAKAELSLSGPGCTKPVIALRDSAADKTDYVVWRRLDQKTGTLVLYKAKDTAVYPYYVAGSLDSFVYDLKQFCTDEERSEDRKGMQMLMEKFCRVDVNPNPFQESFEFQLINVDWPWLTDGQNIELLFLDLNGNAIESSTIVSNKVYSFRFPDLKSGSILFYKLSWGEYRLSGQLKKM